MPNAPVIELVGFRRPIDPEAQKKVSDWTNAAHRPLRRKSPWWIDACRYNRANESEEYPDRITVWHFGNLENFDKNRNDPSWKAASDDENILRDKYGYRTMWAAVYELSMSFRNGAIFTPAGKENTAANSAPIVYLSAFNLSSFIQDKYEEWFSHWGYDVFLPLFMKLPGIIGYDFYKFIKIVESSTGRVFEKDYPAFLSILYFENSFALENYKKSRELAAFQKVMQTDFSGALNTKWDVAYELESIYKREA